MKPTDNLSPSNHPSSIPVLEDTNLCDPPLLDPAPHGHAQQNQRTAPTLDPQSTLKEAEAALAQAREAAERGEYATAGTQYGLALKRANARAQVDANLGAPVDKANRWIQLESLMGLAVHHGRSLEAFPAPLTPLQARQYTWVWGLYRYGLAIAENTWKEKARLKLTSAERTQLNEWKDGCLTETQRYFSFLMSQPLTSWIQLIQRQRDYQASLQSLRDTMKQRLAALNERWPWPVPANEAQAQGLVSLASERRRSETYSESVDNLYDTLRETMITLTAKIFRDAVQDVGPAPCGYSLVGLGSLARGEMTPYSPIECLLLMEKDTPDNRQYFRRVSTVFHGWVIQLQETILPTLAIPELNEEPGHPTDFYDHGLYIQRGCSLDGSLSHGPKTPLGRLGIEAKPWGVELIQTPEHMASCASVWSAQREGDHLDEMLSATVLIAHNQAGATLYPQFTAQVEAWSQEQGSKQNSLRQQRAGQALKRDMKRFDPSIHFGLDGTAIGVKKGLYRLPILLLHGLAAVAGCPAHGTDREALDYLKAQDLVSELTHPVLHLWLSLAKTIRLHICLARGAQQDAHSFAGKTSSHKRPFQAIVQTVENDPILSGPMVRWYQIALPVHGAIQSTINLDPFWRLIAPKTMDEITGENTVKQSPPFPLTTQAEVLIFTPQAMLPVFQQLGLNTTALSWVNEWIKALTPEEKRAAAKNKRGRRKASKKKRQDLPLTTHQALSQAYAAKARLMVSYEDKLHAAEGYNAAKTALAHAKKGYGEETEACIAILDVMGHLASQQDQKNVAEHHWKDCWLLTKSHYGPQHARTAKPLANLGTVAQARGAYGEGKAYLEEALAVQEHCYGREHTKMAAALANLDILAQPDDGYEEPQAHWERAQAIQQGDYAPTHREAATILTHLALIMEARTPYGEIHGDHERTRAIKKNPAPRGDVDTAKALIHLGNLAQTRGAYGEARKYYERALVIQETHYGPTHGNILATLINLGDVARASGTYGAAEKYYERAQEIQAIHHNRKRVKAAATLTDLGAAARARGDYESAQRCYGQALVIQEELCGPGDLKTAATLEGLGAAARDCHAYGEAQGYWERALAIQETHYGPGHLETTKILHHLGAVAHVRGANEEAERYYERALAIQEAHYGQGHVETAATLRSLATIAHARGANEKAQGCYERMLAIQETHYGEKHVETAKALAHLGDVTYARSAYGEARGHYKRALAILKTHYGPRHLETERVRRRLLQVQRSLNKERVAQASVEPSPAAPASSTFFSPSPTEKENAFIAPSSINPKDLGAPPLERSNSSTN